ncbi:MAG: DUF4279 domain-containing protein [Gammaproteobacteria bacterium]|nr:DUF4279 domain-containing protein [Gammaproteobacteria bacterium]
MIQEYPTVTLEGENFSPSVFEKKTGLFFNDKHEKGEPSHTTKRQYDYGYGQLAAPDELKYYQKIEWLLDQIVPHVGLMKNLGVEEKVLHVDVEYSSQCNLEYRPEILKKLCELGATFTLTCYKNTYNNK